ncbi:hypothetical protein BRD16_01710 [Halobacteriales archaeon SW_6_65_46]|nr:MAG: hypothetical protein BRD16_01710 [Halobacteriales archaeon SW_6_65_46]
MSQPTDAGGSWPSKETNSVTAAEEGFQSEAENEEELLLERLVQFEREYPELADLELSSQHGRKLRRVLTESKWEQVTIDVPPEREGIDDAVSTEELRKRSAATWSDALTSFLNAHLEYDGLTARFGNGQETFDVDLSDAWGPDYHDEQYARARALQREVNGTERPSGSSPTAAWDAPLTVMLTLTGSSTPNGSRIAPIDHLDQVHDSFSYEGVRDTLRNTMEYHLGLDSSQWGYWMQTEPHGIGGGGQNSCYTHLHVGVYLDGAGFDGEVIGKECERVIDKHLDVCSIAGESAHDYWNIDQYTDSDEDGCISVNEDVSNLGSYLAAYIGVDTEEDLLERPIEYLAWGALYWATNRQRTTRSQTVNQMIRADQCDQRAEFEECNQTRAHGELVSEGSGNGQDIVCAVCGSPWRVDQDRLDDVPTDDDLNDALDEPAGPDPDPETDVRGHWPGSESAQVGETLTHRRWRQRIAKELVEQSNTPTLPQLAGRLQLPDRFIPLAKKMLDGRSGIPDTHSSRGPPDTDENEWELVGIVDRDGEVHPPGGGGIDMVPLHLPRTEVSEVLKDSVREKPTTHLRCECGVGAHPEDMAAHLSSHGINEPDVATEVVSTDTV